MAKYIAVYGTLKRGKYFNSMLENCCTFVKECKINGKLYDLGSYPGLVFDRDSLCSAELYKINDTSVIKTLDMIEGYYGNVDDCLFIRKVSKILTEYAVETAWVYYYNRQVDEKDLIESGVW